MRLRLLAAIASLGAAAGLLFGATPSRASEATLYAAAKKEGQVVWYTTLIYDTAVQPLIQSFEKTYPGIKVSFARADSVATATKIIEEGRAGRPQADVFDGAESAEPLIKAGDVAKFIPSEAADYPPQLQDPKGYWHAFILYFLAPAVNTRLVPESKRPKTLEDLLAPRWRGKIAWTDSASTGARAFIAGVMLRMGETKGLAFLKKLSAQKPISVGLTARALVNAVAQGEYPLALGVFNHHVAMAAAKGAPVAWLKLDPIVASLAMAGVVKNAPHPNAARLFLDFLLSKKTQELLASRGFLPAMPSVPAKTPDLKPGAGGFSPVYLTPEIVDADFERWQSIYNQLFR